MSETNGAPHKISVLVVTHGDAGVAMVTEVRRLLGESAAEGFEPLPVAAGETREQVYARIDDAVLRLDRGRGVLVIVDLQGSTPCNCALRVKQTHASQTVEVLCGVSLPMLVKVATADRANLSASELAHEAATTAIRSIRMGDGGPA